MLLVFHNGQRNGSMRGRSTSRGRSEEAGNTIVARRETTVRILYTCKDIYSVLAVMDSVCLSVSRSAVRCCNITAPSNKKGGGYINFKAHFLIRQHHEAAHNFALVTHDDEKPIPNS